MKAKKYLYDLRFFDGEGGGSGEGNGSGSGNGSGGNGGGNASYSYEQLEEIASSRAERAKKSALTSYFKQMGMTEEQAAEAFSQYKKQNAQKNDLSAITAERDQYQKELSDLKNKETLRSLKVSDDYMDFVAFKVSAMVTDKKDFATCAKEFLAENKKYTGSQTGYRASGGTEASGAGTGNGNQTINDAIRAATGRKL